MTYINPKVAQQVTSFIGSAFKAVPAPVKATVGIAAAIFAFIKIGLNSDVGKAFDMSLLSASKATNKE